MELSANGVRAAGDLTEYNISLMCLLLYSVTSPAVPKQLSFAGLPQLATLRRHGSNCTKNAQTFDSNWQVKWTKKTTIEETNPDRKEIPRQEIPFFTAIFSPFGLGKRIGYSSAQACPRIPDTCMTNADDSKSKSVDVTCRTKKGNFLEYQKCALMTHGISNLRMSLTMISGKFLVKRWISAYS
jgi:hypothetical protein